ncbi:hypothetical protein [Micromonospora rosaria]|uniref:hypothetical protein n=1 Tax=Micromonospora rosaria TaxID=47874 RepID=UPI000B22D7D4|nr:hypothetical protein [Micromonospora rosaria]
MIAYRAMVDVPRELFQHLAGLLYAQHRACGTRRGTRVLICFYQALMVLVWFRKAEDMAPLAAGFGISRVAIVVDTWTDRRSRSYITEG